MPQYLAVLSTAEQTLWTAKNFFKLRTVVDSYEDEEYIVYFFDTLTTSKEHKFKLAHKAHSFALSQLNKTKVEVLNFV